MHQPVSTTVLCLQYEQEFCNMSIPERIKDLIRTFDYNLESYKKGSYNETQVRREFIDSFFEELGWDIANKKGYSEAYKDMIHEDAIKVGGSLWEHYLFLHDE